MIFIHDKIYAKVWKITKHEKYADIQITTSEKDNDGNYINSGWFPRLIGHAFNSLKDTLKEGDKIVITKSKMTNERYTAQDGSLKSAFRFLILEAEIDNGGAANASPARTSPDDASEPTEDKDNCPW